MKKKFKINFVDFSTRFKNNYNNLLKAFKSTGEEGNYILGKNVEIYEKKVVQNLQIPICRIC